MFFFHLIFLLLKISAVDRRSDRTPSRGMVISRSLFSSCRLPVAWSGYEVITTRSDFVAFCCFPPVRRRWRQGVRFLFFPSTFLPNFIFFTLFLSRSDRSRNNRQRINRMVPHNWPRSSFGLGCVFIGSMHWNLIM